MTRHVPLPVPPFFKAKNAEHWGYYPNLGELGTKAIEWAKQHGIKPAGSDRFRLHVLSIDNQQDFCLPQGTLYVGGRNGRGAIEDSVRAAEFIYRNLGIINGITSTFDTHFAYQIFTPPFLVDKDGKHLAPHTTVSVDKVEKGEVSVNPAIASWLGGNYSWLNAYVLHYCRELAKGGKYELYIWPEHCVIGTPGHNLIGVLSEALMFHAYARGMQNWAEVKGGSPLFENYSVFRGEVLIDQDGKARGQKNAALIKKMLVNDANVFMGQAASHCVKSSIDDLLTEIMAVDPKLADKCYVMTDTTSAVAVPNPAKAGTFFVDYTPQADEAFARFADAGMHLVKSTDPVESWPGIRL
jgi:nicotinamidase-related amidase